MQPACTRKESFGLLLDNCLLGIGLVVRGETGSFLIPLLSGIGFVGVVYHRLFRKWELDRERGVLYW